MEEVRQEYDRIAPHYDRRWRPYIEATLAGVLDAADFQGDESILDVPCGTGELERRLLNKWPNLKITGADLSPGMLAYAIEKDTGGRVKWIEANVCSLPLGDAVFDCVVCANSFHYFRHPRESLRELSRVLKPGGTLILVDWCDDYIACKLCSFWLRLRDPAFYRTYSVRECGLLLEEAGFTCDPVERFRINWLWGLMRFVGHKNG